MNEFHKILQRKLREHPDTSHFKSEVTKNTLRLFTADSKIPFVAIGHDFLPIWEKNHQAPSEAVDAIFALTNECRQFEESYRHAPSLRGENNEAENENGYRILSEHGQILLAAKLRGNGQYICTTWQYESEDKQQKDNGHYHMNNYKVACLDFALRSGLISENILLTPSDAEVILHGLHALDQMDYEGLSDRQMKASYDLERKIHDAFPKAVELVSLEQEPCEEMELG